MPFNVVGPKDAIDAVARDIEAERAKDPSYPWRFDVRESDGPALDGDCPDLTERHHRLLIELSKRHPEVVVVTGQVDRDSDTGAVVNADLIRYAKGRRRTVASVRSDADDRGAQIARMIKMSLRYEQQREHV